MTNIFLSAQGTIGDIISILSIGRILKTGGASVAMLTHCAYEKRVRDAGLEFVALDNMEEFQQYIEAIAICETPRGNIEFQRRHVLPMAEREISILTERCIARDTILIGSHMLLFGPQIAAEKLGLPLVRMFAAPVALSRLFLFEIMCRDVLAEDINGLRVRNGLPRIPDWDAWLRNPQRNLGAWPEWFTAPEPEWPTGLDLALPGFLTMDEPGEKDSSEELDGFLQAGPPPVLIAGSTGTYLKKNFYEVAIQGCQLAGQRGLVVTRFREALPAHLPEQIKWFPSLPFASLMPRMAAVIHHGGMGTLATALHAGIPQLVLAAGSDRPDNAQRLQRLGVAEHLPLAKWKAEPIARSIEQLLGSPAIRERCQKMADLARNDDPASLIQKLVRDLAASHASSAPAAAEQKHG